MSINDSCPCYPHYEGLPQSPDEPFNPVPGGNPPPTGGYVDVPLSLLNGNFDLAAGGNHTTPDNWNSFPATGDFYVDDGGKGIAPVSAPYSAMGRDIHACQATSNEIDLVADGASAINIDTGQTFVRLDYKYAANKDQGAAGFVFYDASHAQISVIRGTYVPETNSVWTDQTYRTSVPIGTRYLRVYLDLYRLGGDDLNANYDDLVATFEDIAP